MRDTEAHKATKEIARKIIEQADQTHTQDIYYIAEIAYEAGRVAGLEEAEQKITQASANIRPHVVIGDDDSIYLTDMQAGEKAGLGVALQVIRALKEKNDG